MGIFDKVKQKLSENRDKIDQAVDKAGDLVDEKTGGKYAEKVDQVQDFAKEQADRHVGDADSATPSSEPDPGTSTPEPGPSAEERTEGNAPPQR